MTEDQKTPAKPRRWKLIGLAVVVAFAALALVACSAIFLSPDPNEIALQTRIPDLSLVDSDGKPVSRDQLVAGARPILVVYRGRW